MQFLSGKCNKGRMILLYGAPGIGKTTTAGQAPRPLFIDLEGGCDVYGFDRTPILSSYPQFLEAMKAAKASDYQTIVIDTIDALEGLIHEDICKKNRWPNIEHLGYGKGYAVAQEEWTLQLRGLQAIKESGKNIILLAHEIIRTYTPPDGEPYDRYQIKINAKSASLIYAACDAVLFAKIETETVSTGQGKKRRGVGSGKRLVYTEEEPAFAAKNRFGIPSPRPLNSEILTATGILRPFEETKPTPALLEKAQDVAASLGGELTDVIPEGAFDGNNPEHKAMVSAALNSAPGGRPDASWVREHASAIIAMLRAEGCPGEETAIAHLVHHYLADHRGAK